jgi:crotonobetainyl-CoA:carnitine CoA-transferase CaiB-like acyl-CoA transferase
MTVGHDLNFVALAGALDRVGPAPFGVAGIQLADVTTGLLAAQGILAALLRRERTGRGCILAQPLAAGPLPFVLWSWADAAAGPPASFTDDVLGGRCPAYSVYSCSDGKRLAVGCLEPKFWLRFCERVGKPDLGPLGLATDERGRQARSAMADHLATEPQAHWMAALEGEDLPVSPVHDLASARSEPSLAAAGLLESLALADGTVVQVPGPSVPGLGAPRPGCAPKLGEHTRSVLREFAIGEP